MVLECVVTICLFVLCFFSPLSGRASCLGCFVVFECLCWPCSASYLCVFVCCCCLLFDCDVFDGVCMVFVLNWFVVVYIIVVLFVCVRVLLGFVTVLCFWSYFFCLNEMFMCAVFCLPFRDAPLF